MSKKILIVAHYSRFLLQFETSDVKCLQAMGFKVHYATNYHDEDMYHGAVKQIQALGVVLHQVDFVRSPFLVAKNVKAYGQLKMIMRMEKFCGVHCHTPIAGALSRLAAKATNTKPVIYTAHGFHFYKGCSFMNWILYKGIERFLAHYTDVIILINQEDYTTAQTFIVRGKIYHIHGIGVDVNAIKILPVDKMKKREELNIPQDAVVFISVGELNRNKNHITALRAFAKAKIPNSYYLICGEGELRNKLQEEIKNLGLCSKVILLGFQTNIITLLKIANVFVFPSIREGLGLAAIEAMAAGLPIIATKNRGSAEYAQDGWCGRLCKATSIKNFAQAMQFYAEKKCTEVVENQLIAQQFDILIVEEQMKKIYKSIFKSI